MNIKKQIYPILIVDDEEAVCSALKRELKNLAPVIISTDVEDAMSVLKNHTVAVVISDYKMPKLNGLDFLNNLNNLVINYEPIKILLTAYSDVDIFIEALNKTGVYSFIRKPWDYEEIQIIVKNAINLFYSKNELSYCKKRLQELDKIKKGVSSLLAHELRTPLTTISGYSEMILNAVVDECELKNMAFLLNNSVERLVLFIEDILSIVDIESGKYEDTYSILDISYLLNKNICSNISLCLNEPVKVKTNNALIEQGFKKFYNFLSKFNVSNVNYFKYDNLIIINYYLKFIKQKHDYFKQLSLFEELEINDSVSNYGGEHDLSLIFTQKVLATFGAKLSFFESNADLKKIELAIPFI